MKWKIFDSGKKSAENNMALDAELLRSLSNEPILHLYDWDKQAATYGHFIKPQMFFHEQSIKKLGVDLAKRPTGGGIVFHIADYAFSALVPSSHKNFSFNPLDNYLYINSLVGDVLGKFLGKAVQLLPTDNRLEKGDFCMAKPTKYDLILNGKKVGGAAQRKTKEGYLHQGSIFLGHLPCLFLSEILKDSSIIEIMHEKSSPLLGDSWSKNDLYAARQELKDLFTKVFI